MQRLNRDPVAIDKPEEKSGSVLSRELLDAYRSITCSENISEPTLETVRSLLKRHGHAFAYSTLPANLEEEQIVADPTKLATDLINNREGICFHHVITFYEVLKDLGFDVYFVACKFQKDDSEELYPIATHAGIILTLAGKRYYVDPGTGQPLNDVIPFQADEENASRYRLVASEDNHFEIRKSKNDSFVCAFEDKPIAVSDLQEGMNTLKRPDGLNEDGSYRQGHAFYSAFHYSKFNGISSKFESLSADVSNHKLKIVNHSIYDNLQTFFNTGASQLHKMKTGQFVNPALKDLVFEDKVPGVYQRSSCASWRR